MTINAKTELYKSEPPSKATHTINLNSGRQSESRRLIKLTASKRCSSLLDNIIYWAEKVKNSKQNVRRSKHVVILSGLKWLVCWRDEILLYLHHGLTGFLFCEASD